MGGKVAQNGIITVLHPMPVKPFASGNLQIVWNFDRKHWSSFFHNPRCHLNWNMLTAYIILCTWVICNKRLDSRTSIFYF